MFDTLCHDGGNECGTAQSLRPNLVTGLLLFSALHYKSFRTRGER